MPKQHYKVGEGLIGQVVKLRQPLYFGDLYQQDQLGEARNNKKFARGFSKPAARSLECTRHRAVVHLTIKFRKLERRAKQTDDVWVLGMRV
jgi:hypothetical protein